MFTAFDTTWTPLALPLRPIGGLMDLSAASLFAALFVSSVGFSLFLYGKKQLRFPQLIVGLVLMIYPYFVTDALAVWGIAVALIVALALVVRSGRF